MEIIIPSLYTNSCRLIFQQPNIARCKGILRPHMEHADRPVCELIEEEESVAG